jgi:hypothetical protein
MKRYTSTLIRFSLTLVILLSLGSAHVPTARAEPLDHLTCYRVEDTSEGGATVALDTLPFGVDAGCVVQARARELCLPASAAVLEGTPADGTQGDELTIERTCYRIDCPERELPAVQVTDRFGTRALALKGARTVCVPAVSTEQP